ncbi:uncharacterized protein TNCV_3726371 [Trichonephila clavipes]|nr:uncharacterized protein TNCV_3726371 [Trichonephila clavipes]
MSQVRMDCEARVPRYWPKSCRERGGCVPTDMVYISSYYDPPNISPLAPKKWHVKILDNGTTTSVPSSSASDNPQCTSTSNIFPQASTSEVRPIIPTDSEQNKGDDSEKEDKEEVQSNNESNRDRESEEDKDRPERFIYLDVEMLNDIAL